MFVYKYRSGDTSVFEGKKKTFFERDLYSLEKNYFWSAKKDTLNDPNDSYVSLSSFNESIDSGKFILSDNNQIKALQRLKESAKNLFDSRSEEMGIFSLSRTFKDELLWAHYGNSHKGFCI